MSEHLLIRWLVSLLKRACYASVYGLAICVVGAVFTLDAGRSSTSLREREQERELWRFQLRELERQAEHKRLLELLEALKPRRDLSLPAEPEEIF
jgi:hypothetical protein